MRVSVRTAGVQLTSIRLLDGGAPCCAAGRGANKSSLYEKQRERERERRDMYRTERGLICREESRDV